MLIEYADQQEIRKTLRWDDDVLIVADDLFITLNVAK